MAVCPDPRYERMHGPYELGMLSEGERREFEHHLLECESCFESVREYRDAARLFRHDSDVRETVRQIVEDASAAPSAQEQLSTRPRPGIRRLRFYVPTFAVAAAIFLFFMLTDWQLRFRPSREAEAHLDRLAVMYFENLADPADPDRLGDIIANLVITDLSESHYVGVVSSQRLYDILGLMGGDGEQRIARELATEVARRAEARWMLLGSILQVEPQLAVSIQLVEVETGNMIASQTIMGRDDEDVFAIVDQLTKEIKSRLPLPGEALQEFDPPIANATTHSRRAYRLFLDGFRLVYAFETDSAKQKFQAAIEEDSAFAMAYLGLYLCHYGYYEEEQQRKLIDAALRHIDNVTRREKWYIFAAQAMINGKKEQAREYYRKILAEYPDEWMAIELLAFVDYTGESLPFLHKILEENQRHADAYDALAMVSRTIGDCETAMWAAKKYVELKPDLVRAYQTLAQTSRLCGHLQEAITAYEQARRIDPEYLGVVPGLGIAYQLNGQYAEAESIYNELATNPLKVMRARGKSLLASIPLQQGNFREALRRLAEAEAQARSELGPSDELRAIIWRRAHIFLFILKDYDSAMAEIEKADSVYRSVRADQPTDIGVLGMRAVVYAHRDNRAQARSLVKQIESYEEPRGGRALQLIYLVYAEEALGNYDAAAAYVEELTARWPSYSEWVRSGRIYLKAGRLADAVKSFEKAHEIYGYPRVYWASDDVMSYYWLAQAYERSGWNDRAVEQYQIFYDYWKDADPMIPEVEDARRRLERMQA